MKSVIVIFAIALAVANASCPNHCSGHGVCDKNDQCTCFLEAKVLNEEGNEASEREVRKIQWTGADCSLMTCPRGTSWGRVKNFMEHRQGAECSDAGICDRKTGECQCYTGYDGSACQRTTCPNNCNGHGICASNKDFAEQYARAMATSINEKRFAPRCANKDSSTNICQRNVEHLDDYYATYMVSYENAWDSGLQYGCNCDAGFAGADCSQRECPTNNDPVDDNCQMKWSANSYPQIDGAASEASKSVPFANDVKELKKHNYLYTTASVDNLYTYLDANYVSDTVFNNPDKFVTARSHFSDLARSCSAFYISPSLKLPKTSATWNIVPFSLDSWACDYMWDSTMVKVPWCGGQWSSQECSGRGLCDRTTGSCKCASGYSGNDCSKIEELS